MGCIVNVGISTALFGATVGQSDCIKASLVNTATSTSVGDIFVKPYTMPAAIPGPGAGQSYKVNATLSVSVTSGVTYRTEWFMIVPSANMTLGDVTSGVLVQLIDVV